MSNPNFVVFEGSLARGTLLSVVMVTNFVSENLEGRGWKIKKDWPKGTDEIKRFKGEIFGSEVAIIFTDNAEQLLSQEKVVPQKTVLVVLGACSETPEGLAKIIVINGDFSCKDNFEESVWLKLVDYFRELRESKNIPAWNWD